MANKKSPSSLCWIPGNSISGFTLVEMMVVVAIIGVLSSIAVPSYTGMISRSRQTEAKIQLSALFTAESTFSADSGSYSQCLRKIGYEEEGTNRYYLVGFWNGSEPMNCGPAGNATCYAYDWSTGLSCDCSGITYFGNYGGNDCTLSNNLTASSTSQWPNPVWNVNSASNFTAGAMGSISQGSTVVDMWTIDQTRNLQNPLVGL